MKLCPQKPVSSRQAMVDTPVTTAKARGQKAQQCTGLPPEYPEGERPRTGSNDEVIGELQQLAKDSAAKGEDVDPSPIPEGTYKTDKEKLAIAIEKYTPTTAKQDQHPQRLR